MPVKPLTLKEAEEYKSILNIAEDIMGYVPNSMLVMAKDRELLMGFGMLSTRCMNINGKKWMPGVIILFIKMVFLKIFGKKPKRMCMKLRALVLTAVSLSAGCRYCQAHSASLASRCGVSDEKVLDILKYSESEKYSEKERTALDIAFAAGKIPNEVTEDHFIKLAEHFTEEEIIDLVATISYMGFLNRWNDTMGTYLESVPLEYASSRLSDLGWSAGKHR